jgi:hypothetical protein
VIKNLGVKYVFQKYSQPTGFLYIDRKVGPKCIPLMKLSGIDIQSFIPPMLNYKL